MNTTTPVYKFNKTKIIGTLGPASSSKEMLRSMILNGLDVVRLNFSHANYDNLRQVIQYIHELNDEIRAHVAILADLQGPKIRIGEMENNGVLLEIGDELTITTTPCIGNKKQLYINYLAFPSDVSKGDQILLDDGKIKLEVIKTDKKGLVEVKVLFGGILSSKKGVNLPNTPVSLPSLTEKDLRDLEFALEAEVDWIALSFVRTAADIIDLRERIKAAGKDIGIVSKIEKPAAVSNIDEIIAVSDAVMVARGDLGVEYPIEKLPLIQKMIIKKCRKAAKPVIVATQMMESMITNFMPTRAEANDVANAVLDGADALMLSGETSVGVHPDRVIEFMDRIIETVEKENLIYNREMNLSAESHSYLSDTMCYMAVQTATQINAKAIVGMTVSGYTGYRVSSFRPIADIFIFTRNKRLMNRLSLCWGVRVYFYDKESSTDDSIQDVMNFLVTKKFLKKGDIMINLASMPLEKKQRTNMLKFSVVE